MIDPYQILGVSQTATPEEIKKAYRQLAMQHHPDRNSGDAASLEKFNQIQTAYDILINGKAPPRQQFNPFTKIFEQFFGGNPERGRNLQIRVEIEFKDVLHGVKKQLNIPNRVSCGTCHGKGFTEWQACVHCSGSGKAFVRQPPYDIFSTCKACQGTGRSAGIACKDCDGTAFKTIGEKTIDIAIPAGVDTGTQIRVPGEGEPSKTGGKVGDLMIVIVVKDHPFYGRQNRDLVLQMPCTYTELLFGTQLNMKTLEDHPIVLDIPAGTKSGTFFRMKRMGLPDFTGRGRGDLVVEVLLDIPQNYTEGRYGELLKELSLLEKGNISEQRRGFDNKKDYNNQ